MIQGFECRVLNAGIAGVPARTDLFYLSAGDTPALPGSKKVLLSYFPPRSCMIHVSLNAACLMCVRLYVYVT